MGTRRYDSSRRRAIAVAQTVASFLGSCDNTAVRVYGPYPPVPGRTRWRVQIIDPTTKKKKGMTAPTKAEAEILVRQIQEQVQKAQPIRVSEAIEQYLEFKAALVAPEWLRTLGDRLRGFLPDALVSSISPETAQELYLAETRRLGRRGKPISAATHQHLLRNVKEFFGWLVKRRLAKSNPFEHVESIGKANAGKEQPRQQEATALDELLLAHAKRGDEGALALLVQIYLGKRSKEILSLEVGDVALRGGLYFVAVASRQGQGKTKNAKRTLELAPVIGELLWRHCSGRPTAERVFAANLPKRPASDWMNKRLKKFCQEAGMQGYCPHSLRGLHSSLALESGATTHQVAASLGHASFSTTAKHYADPAAVENARIRKVAQALRGGNAAEHVAQLTESERRQLLVLLGGRQ